MIKSPNGTIGPFQANPTVVDSPILSIGRSIFLRLLCLIAAAIENHLGRKMAQNTQMELSGRKRGRNIRPLSIGRSIFSRLLCLIAAAIENHLGRKRAQKTRIKIHSAGECFFIFEV
jgi:hypothetical protein